MPLTADEQALLATLKQESRMKTVYVTSQEELDAACDEQEALGNRLAAASNRGCPRGSFRLTFLPQSAFTTPTTGGDHDDA